jgi:hypothetical protein
MCWFRWNTNEQITQASALIQIQLQKVQDLQHALAYPTGKLEVGQ